MDEIKNFDQEDMDEYDIMLLDAQEEVYVWIGKKASENERILAPRFAEVNLRIGKSFSCLKLDFSFNNLSQYRTISLLIQYLLFVYF